MYDSNPEQYYIDQMTRFESFEGELYAEGIKKTIEHVFPEKHYDGFLLDLCCGDGTTSKYLYGKGFGVIGFDGNERKIEKAKIFSDNLYIVGSVECLIDNTPNWHEKFDIIYASHCFEHFINPIVILKEIKKYILPDGFIILILPYPNESSEGHPGSNLLKLNGSLEDVKNNLTDNGFEVISIEQVNFREPEIIIHLR